MDTQNSSIQVIQDDTGQLLNVSFYIVFVVECRYELVSVKSSFTQSAKFVPQNK